MDRSWFTDTVATSVIRLPLSADSTEVFADEGDGITIISTEVSPPAKGDGAIAVVRWIPERNGLVRFPSLEIKVGEVAYRTPAKELIISAPLRSSEMTFTVVPAKTRVYAGEPVRIDIRWDCPLPARRVRDLRVHPAFFNTPGIEVVVPRSTVPEEAQVGVPFGGRRIIAHRQTAEGAREVGEVTFSVFLRFIEPGAYDLSTIRLECALLKEDGGAFAPYAAYFNNGLFETVAPGKAYDRIYVESAALAMEVLPLPAEGRLESFSGLFAPCTIEVTTTPSDSEVGQLLAIDLLVRSDAPHGFLQLPNLTRQRSLRSWFKVDEELGRAWDENGTLFRARARTLTTAIKAFPALEVQIFDPATGTYQILQTDPQPLTVTPRDGRDYFDVKSLATAPSTLTDQTTGVWHNRKVEPMNALLNSLGNFLADAFWLLLAAGPVLFFVLLPFVREARRRALDPRYRARQDAYRTFRRLPEGSPAKWSALQAYLATSLGAAPEAWTRGDTQRELTARGLSAEDLEVLTQSHEHLDAVTYSAQKRPSALPPLNPIAQRISKLLAHTLVLALAFSLTHSTLAAEADWDAANTLFERAQLSEKAPAEVAALYAQSALKFEAAARTRSFSGLAWYNAGNAWFHANETGRAIAAYRQAEILRPFDPLIRENLAATRALAIDVVADQRPAGWLRWPARWLQACLVLASIAFWASLLGAVRYRSHRWTVASVSACSIALVLAALTLRAHLKDGSEGVVVVSEIYGRKGPSYHFQTAFNEPLHDGLEFNVVEKRDNWLLIQLYDQRQAWIPSTQAQLLSTR